MTLPVIEAWSGASQRDVLALLQQEYTRWFVELGWDLSRDWAAVDPARRAGLVPGWIARDDRGRPRGWAFGVEQPGVLQLGAVVAADAATLESLLDQAAQDRDTLLFVRSSDVVSASALAALGFSVQPYRYLVATSLLRSERCEPFEMAAWNAGDLEATASLLARAYASDLALRPFARQGTLSEWIEYVEAITLRPGCGEFSANASVTLRHGGELVAVALVTSVGPTTAHLAQLAIVPAMRGRGISRAVLSTVRHNAARVLKSSRCSLLVSEANPAACALYARAGFRQDGAFLAAHRPAQPDQPLRFINTAPATGGDSARR
jgi:ribosomal protein S18 acetylase RimI-like enzyme